MGREVLHFCLYCCGGLNAAICVVGCVRDSSQSGVVCRTVVWGQFGRACPAQLSLPFDSLAPVKGEPSTGQSPASAPSIAHIDPALKTGGIPVDSPNLSRETNRTIFVSNDLAQSGSISTRNSYINLFILIDNAIDTPGMEGVVDESKSVETFDALVRTWAMTLFAIRVAFYTSVCLTVKEEETICTG